MRIVALEVIQQTVLQAIGPELAYASRGKEGQAQIKHKVLPFVEEVVRSKMRRASDWTRQWKELDALLAQNNLPPDILLSIVRTVLAVMEDE